MSRARAEPCFMGRRSRLQSCRMHPLVNAAAVATGQLCVDLLSLVDSLDAGLTLDPGGGGALCTCLAGVRWLTPPLSCDTLRPALGVDATFPRWVLFTWPQALLLTGRAGQF